MLININENDGRHMSLEYAEVLQESLFGDDVDEFKFNTGDNKLFGKTMSSAPDTAYRNEYQAADKIAAMEKILFANKVKQKYRLYRDLDDSILNDYKRIYEIMRDNNNVSKVDLTTTIKTFEYLIPVQKYKGKNYHYASVTFDIDYFVVSDLFKEYYGELERGKMTYSEIKVGIHNEVEKYLKQNYWILDIPGTMLKFKPSANLKAHIDDTKIVGDTYYKFLHDNMNKMSNLSMTLTFIKKLYGEQVRLYEGDVEYLEIVKGTFDLMLSYVEKIINFNYIGSNLASISLKNSANNMKEIYNSVKK